MQPRVEEQLELRDGAGTFHKVGCIGFDPFNIGSNLVVSRDRLSLMRHHGQQRSVAWCPDALPVRSMRIGSEQVDAFGFSVVVRRTSKHGVATLKIGLSNRPLKERLATSILLVRSGIARVWPENSAVNAILGGTHHGPTAQVDKTLVPGDVLTLCHTLYDHRFVLQVNDEVVLDTVCRGWRAGDDRVYAVVDVRSKCEAIDLVPIFIEWSPQNHSIFDADVRQAIKTVATLALVDKRGGAVFEGSPWFVLPIELLFEIYRFIAL